MYNFINNKPYVIKAMHLGDGEVIYQKLGPDVKCRFDKYTDDISSMKEYMKHQNNKIRDLETLVNKLYELKLKK